MVIVKFPVHVEHLAAHSVVSVSRYQSRNTTPVVFYHCRRLQHSISWRVTNSGNWIACSASHPGITPRTSIRALRDTRIDVATTDLRYGMVYISAAHVMANSKQNGAPLFVTPDPKVNPGAHYTSPDSAYPQTCMHIIPQRQRPPVSCKDNVLFGKTSVIWLGVALLLCGVLSQIGAAVAFRSFAGLSDVGVGVWCGYMFSAAGAVAIVAAHHENKELVNGTALTSGLAVVAAITQLCVAAAGLAKDVGCYSCLYNQWNSAVAANSMMVFAACMALMGGARLFRIAGIAVCGEQTSFQIHSKPVQYAQQQQQQLMSLNYPHPITIHPPVSSQIHSTSVQHVHQQQQQLMPLNHPHPSTIHPQVVQMPAAYIPLQTSTTSTIPNQQMLSVPIQYVLPHQQLISLNLNHPPTNTIDPATSAQVHVRHEAPKNDDRDAETF